MPEIVIFQVVSVQHIAIWLTISCSPLFCSSPWSVSHLSMVLPFALCKSRINHRAFMSGSTVTLDGAKLLSPLSMTFWASSASSFHSYISRTKMVENFPVKSSIWSTLGERVPWNEYCPLGLLGLISNHPNAKIKLSKSHSVCFIFLFIWMDLKNTCLL